MIYPFSKKRNENSFIKENKLRLFLFINTWACFTPKLVWTKTKENLAEKANNAIITIKILQNKLGSLSIYDCFKLFDTMIVPILCYGSEIWGFEIANQIETVHDRFCKSILKVPIHTTSVFAWAGTADLQGPETTVLLLSFSNI